MPTQSDSMGKLKASDLFQLDLLQTQAQDGRVLFNRRRAVIFDADAIGTLRQQLIESVGEELARGVLTRFGYAHGYNDATMLEKSAEWETETDWLAAGPIMHVLEGLVQVDPQEIAFDRDTGRFLMHGIWLNSYEAEQHLRLFGASDHPVCWTLTGYASGYATAFFGRELLAIETECVGKGDARCYWEIRPVAEWAGDARAQPYLVALEQVDLSARIELANQQLQEQNEQLLLQSRRLAVLNEIGRALSSTLDPDHLVRQIYEQSSRVFDTTNFFVAFYDEGADYITFPLYYEDGKQIDREPMKIGEGFTSHVVRSRQPLLLRDRVQEAATLGLAGRGRTSLSWLGVPMLAGERLVGAITVQSYTKPFCYDENDRDLLLTVASQAAIALENARLYAQTKTQVEDLIAINRIGRAIGASLNLAEILDILRREISSHLGLDSMYVALYSSETDLVEFPLFFEHGSIVYPEAQPLGAGVTGYVIHQDRPVLLNTSQDFDRLGIEYMGELCRSYLGVPMRLGERMTGVLAIQDYGRDYAYDEHTLNFVQAIATQTAVALQSAQLFAGVEAQVEQRTQELGRSEAKFREMVRNTEVGIFRTSMSGEIIESNPAAMRIGGLSPQDGTSMNLMQSVDPGDRQRLLAALHQRGSVAAFEVRFRRPDGRVLDIALSARLVMDSEGAPALIEGTLEDITERKRLQQAVHAVSTARSMADLASEFLRAALSGTPVDRAALLIASRDSAGQVLGWRYVSVYDPNADRFSALPPTAPASGVPLSSHVVDTGATVIVEHVEHDSRLDPQSRSLLAAQGVQAMALVPSVVREHVTALLVLSRSEPGPFDAATVAFAELALAQVGPALENAFLDELREEELQNQLQRRVLEVQTLSDISQEIATAPSLPVLFQRVVTLVKARLGYYHAQVFRFDPGADAVLLIEGYGEVGMRMKDAGHRLEYGKGLVGTAAATGQPQLAGDVTQSPDWRANPHLPHTQGELAVPIKLREEVLGVLDVQSDVAGALNEADQILLMGIGGLTASAIDAFNLRQETEARLEEISALYRRLSREAWQEYAAESAAHELGFTFDLTVSTPVGEVWTPEMGLAAQEGRPVVLDAETLRKLKDTGPLPKSALAVPVRLRGEVIGVLDLAEPGREYQWTADDISLVQEVADQVALAIESARLLDQTQAERARLGTLYEVTRTLSGDLTLDDVLRGTLDITRLVGAEHADLLLLDVGGRPLLRSTLVARAALPEPRSSEMIEALTSHGLQAWIMARQQSVVINETDQDERWLVVPDPAFEDPVHSVICVPMLNRTGNIMGTLTFTHSRPGAFTADHLRLAEEITARAAVAIENALLFELTQSRARREQVLRQVTARIREALDVDTILRTTAQEIGRAMGSAHTIVRLGTYEDFVSPAAGHASPGSAQVPLEPDSASSPAAEGGS